MSRGAQEAWTTSTPWDGRQEGVKAGLPGEGKLRRLPVVQVRNLHLGEWRSTTRSSFETTFGSIEAY